MKTHSCFSLPISSFFPSLFLCMSLSPPLSLSVSPSLSLSLFFLLFLSVSSSLPLSLFHCFEALKDIQLIRSFIVSR